MPAFRKGILHTLRLAALLLVVLGFTSCGAVLPVEYEYDEEVYLELDGSGTVYVNASVPALVALRGAPLDVDPRARLDRNDVRAFFESPVVEVESVTTSRRDNRRYVHVRLNVPDIRRLHEAAPFAWSRYTLKENDDLAVFQQTIGPSAARDVGSVGWTGEERVAFRLHLPSRVPFHNAQGREIERGNIIRWEQSLAQRLEGEPLEIEVHMETESILFQTLALFGVTIVLALSTLALAIWWVMRRKGADVPGTRKELPGTPS
jgi:hypothetical protein